MTRIGVSLCAVVLTVTACGRSGTYAANGNDDDDEVPGTETPPGSPVATSTPFAPDTGDGHDGPLTVGAFREFDLCVPLRTAEGLAAEVAPVHPFLAGSRVFLHQVQDGVTRGQPSPMTDPLRAGRWTIARVTAVAGATLTLDRAVERYESQALAIAQACLAPELTDFTATGTIVPREWDGASGGVLVFFVKGTATLADVHATAAGFRGGAVGPSSAARPTADDVPLGEGGGKGEGLHAGSVSLAGRGSVSTDGGGGNGRSAGGGGGGAGGAGGIGGRESDEIGAMTPNADAGGRGGRAVGIALLDRVVFGGGGGAGQQDDGLGGAGGWGGGIVMIFAERFAGDLVVHADGENGEDSGTPYQEGGGGVPLVPADGAGGGGAGGSVLLWSRSVSAPTSVFVSARGGKGGWTHDSGTYHSGPGGGGGGGFVHLERIATPTIFIHGGGTGFTTGSDAWGATEGSRGTDTLVY